MKNDLVLGVAGICGALLVAGLLAWAGGQHGAVIAEQPLMLWCAVFAFGVQWVVFLHAWVARTEAFFDLTGSVTYVIMIGTALIAAGAFDARSVIIAGLVVIWAARLGPFLYLRTRGAGEDRRFRSIKRSFPVFLMTWTLQGCWVFVTASCALAALTSARHAPANIWLYLGVAIWICGFVLEVAADRQKTAFRMKPENADRFITHGLWAWSRHPNYFGEIVLWIGIAVIAVPVLQGWQYATLISPAFVILLLTRISGVRMLEARAERAWGDDPDYRQYRDTTPMLIPMRPRR